MKKALVAALTFMLVGFMLVNGTLAGVFAQARDIFADLTETLGAAIGAPATDGKFDVDLVNVGKVEQLYPGGQATHTVQVVNRGELGACFRLAFAVQKTSTWDKLRIGFTQGAGFEQSGWMPIKIGNDDYNMMVFTYTGTLEASEASPVVGITIAMEKDITSQQISEYRSDFLQTQVLAIEADTFLNATNSSPAPYETPKDALNAALPLTNFNPFD